VTGHTTECAKVKEAEMIDRTIQKKRLFETVETVFEGHSLRSINSLKRGGNERKNLCGYGAREGASAVAFADGNVGVTKDLPRVFLRKKPGANHQTKPTKENRKDAHAAIKS